MAEHSGRLDGSTPTTGAAPGEEPLAVSAPEARQALETVRAVQRRTRRALSVSGGGEILMIWGVVWMVGYLASQLYPWETAGKVWAVVDLLGIAGTLAVVSRISTRVSDPLGPRIGALWLILALFSGLWLWVAAPVTGNEVGFLVATFAMFGYVVMGLWLDLVFLVVGLVVTVFATVGFLFFEPHFNLWMAVLGGGTLLGSGLYIRLRWR